MQKRPILKRLYAVYSFFRGLFSFAVFLCFFLFIVMEVTTPTLSFSPDDPLPNMHAATPGEWVSPTANSGFNEKTYRTIITTANNRKLQADFFAPPTLGSGPIPLTIIVSSFLPPEKLFQQVRPQGYNATLIYRSPRYNRIMTDSWPSWAQISNASSFGDYWNILCTNPLTKFYNTHAGFHETPDDITDIVLWARKNIHADMGRINLIGLGSGAMTAAAAANQLNTIGLPVRTLTLIYPPADLPSAIADNLIFWPTWMRNSIGLTASLLYARLDLNRHLPRVGAETTKLIIVPINSFDLAAYAAAPSILLAGSRTTVQRIDVNFKGYYTTEVIETVRQTVGKWLVAQSAIPSF